MKPNELTESQATAQRAFARVAELPVRDPVQAYEPKQCTCCYGSGRRESDGDPCTCCSGLGRTLALRSTQDGGEVPAQTCETLAESLRAIITNDLDIYRPELPNWLLDRLALHAFAAERL